MLIDGVGICIGVGVWVGMCVGLIDYLTRGYFSLVFLPFPMVEQLCEEGVCHWLGTFPVGCWF